MDILASQHWPCGNLRCQLRWRLQERMYLTLSENILSLSRLSSNLVLSYLDSHNLEAFHTFWPNLRMPLTRTRLPKALSSSSRSMSLALIFLHKFGQRGSSWQITIPGQQLCQRLLLLVSRYANYFPHLSFILPVIYTPSTNIWLQAIMCFATR